MIYLHPKKKKISISSANYNCMSSKNIFRCQTN